MFRGAYATWQHQVGELVDKADDMLKELQGMRHARVFSARATAGGVGDPSGFGPLVSGELFLLQVWGNGDFFFLMGMLPLCYCRFFFGVEGGMAAVGSGRYCPLVLLSLHPLDGCEEETG